MLFDIFDGQFEVRGRREAVFFVFAEGVGIAFFE